MQRNILIVEDKPVCSRALSKIIGEMQLDTVISCAASIEEAYQVLANRRIHLFLLDIILDSKDSGDVSGLLFAEELRRNAKYKYTPIIFITSLEDPKLYTYSQLHCYDYIEKPFSVPRVRDTILSALEMPVIPDDERFIYFRKEGIIYSKRLKEIVYIESNRRRIHIHCVDDELEIPYKTTEELLRELDSESFIQCSRYSILNRNYIEQIDYTNRYVKLKYIREPIEIGIVMGKVFRQKIENG
ncbi:MAG: LytTR family DNA-binding domain-containing protein [Roseburia sp.]|nr:LytTR family DNA-binding domain-containing protein [Roseburia sp.]